MVKIKSIFAAVAMPIMVGAAFCVSGCASGEARQSNDYLLIARAPLVVPPEYKLRPPQAGLAQPSEIAEVAGVTRTFGANVGAEASPVEVALVRSAKAMAVSPVIRGRIDYEEAAVIRKPNVVSDNIRGFEQDTEAHADAKTDIATGGDVVTIGAVSKLPGT